MAAITVNLEEADEPVSETIKEYRKCGGGLRGAGLRGADSCPAPNEVINESHAALLSMVWARQAAIEQLEGLDFEVDTEGRDVILRFIKNGEPFNIGRQDTRCETDKDYCGALGEPAWNPAGVGSIATLTTWTTKMCCPSFSLPSGHSAVGGFCPGAVQSVVPEREWEATYRQALHFMGQPARGPFDIASTICQHCYAAHGKYGTGGVQVAQLMRGIWVRAAVADHSFVEVMDWAVKNANYKLAGNKNLPKEVSGQKYFRIHDSGDFESFEYLRAWFEVIRKNPDVLFWAPTRTWSRPSGKGGQYDRWIQEIGEKCPDNLVMRPSAFVINSPVPDFPGKWAAGTTVIASANNRGMRDDLEAIKENYLEEHFERSRTPEGRAKRARAPGGPDGRYDWDCPAYQEDAGKHRCRDAVNMDGEKCCRVCWDSPKLRVNYTLHA